MDGPAQKAPRYYSLCYGDLGTGQDMARDVCGCVNGPSYSKQARKQPGSLARKRFKGVDGMG